MAGAPRSSIAGSGAFRMLTSLVMWKTLFPKVVAPVNTPVQGEWASSTSPAPNMEMSSFNFYRPDKCEMVSFYGLNLCFPVYWWRWVSFHMFIGHLCFIFWEMHDFKDFTVKKELLWLWRTRNSKGVIIGYVPERIRKGHDSKTQIWAQHRVWHITKSANSAVVAAWRSGL